MSLKVVFPNSFTRKANRLARKHPTLVAELRAFHVQLAQGERPGDRVSGVVAAARPLHIRRILRALALI